MGTLQIDNYIIETPLIDIVERLRLILTNGKLREIKYSDNSIVITCPNDNHDNGHEQNPDCHINIDGESIVPYGYFHCFACGAKGDFVRFVSHCFSSSREYAKDWLIQNYGIKIEENIFISSDINLNTAQRKVNILDTNQLESLQNWTPYLAKRKISRQTAEKFNIKYDPKYRMVVFPVYDVKDRLVMLAKRSIDTKTFFMTANVEKPVYCLNYIQKNNINTAVICEGLFDCITAYEYGQNAIATLGSISDLQIEQINKSCLTHIYLCMDNDESGRKFTQTLKSKLNSRILLSEVKLPAGKKDINDLSREEFIACINSAK